MNEIRIESKKYEVPATDANTQEWEEVNSPNCW